MKCTSRRIELAPVDLSGLVRVGFVEEDFDLFQPLLTSNTNTPSSRVLGPLPAVRRRASLPVPGTRVCGRGPGYGPPTWPKRRSEALEVMFTRRGGSYRKRLKKALRTGSSLLTAGCLGYLTPKETSTDAPKSLREDRTESLLRWNVALPRAKHPLHPVARTSQRRDSSSSNLGRNMRFKHMDCCTRW